MRTISHEQEIANLIARYAYLVDDGDFTGLGKLFAQGELVLNDSPPAIGAEGVEAFAHAALQVHDGTPATRHVVSNIIIEIDADGMHAGGQAYYTVFQALADFPLQPIACGRYEDRFTFAEGRWRFERRLVRTSLMGDLSRHRR